jgi:hypothetical protein
LTPEQVAQRELRQDRRLDALKVAGYIDQDDTDPVNTRRYIIVYHASIIVTCFGAIDADTLEEVGKVIEQIDIQQGSIKKVIDLDTNQPVKFVIKRNVWVEFPDEKSDSLSDTGVGQ